MFTLDNMNLQEDKPYREQICTIELIPFSDQNHKSLKLQQQSALNPENTYT